MSARDDSSIGGSPSTFDTQSSSVGGPPTFAAFSPVTLSATTPSRSSRRSTVLVHQKSPLLLATPPQITRALAYSHPFLLPLNTFAGLLTWSTGDSWQSFLLLCSFWAVVLYGDVLTKWAGPLVVGVGLIVGMYGRRYSPLSTSGWSEPARDAKEGTSTNLHPSAAAGKANASDKQKKHARNASEVTSTKHQKTLDEIVESLKEFTGRCNVLLDPLLDMTDFLSTQRTPTSATTKPALTALFMRLLIITPFWIALTIPPWRIITTRRVVLVAGTLLLTWHARMTRVTRTLLWRSALVRKLAAAITGLRFDAPTKPKATKVPSGESLSSLSNPQPAESELSKALRNSPGLQVNRRRPGSEKSAGVKFTFIIYENQRRWVGLGWTNSLFAYERAAWTDEQNTAVTSKDDFELPEVEGGSQMRWKWAPGSRWRVDGVPDEHGPVEYDGEEGRNGWIYYDSKWQNGRRGQDGWGRWTRRRKWYRDAELVEVQDSDEDDQHLTPMASTSALQNSSYSTVGEKMVSPMRSESALPLGDKTISDDSSGKTQDDAASTHSTPSRSFFRPTFRRRPTDRSSMTDKEIPTRFSESLSDDDPSSLGIEMDLELQKQRKEGGEWGIGDEARMNLE